MCKQVRNTDRSGHVWKQPAMILGLAISVAVAHQPVQAAGDRTIPPTAPDRVSTEAAVQATPLVASHADGSQTAATDGAIDQAVAIWLVLEHHRQGDAAAAESAWRELTLRPESEVWRDVGLAMTALMQGNLDDMEGHLVLADLRQPDHPIVQYVWGVYHVTKSDRSPRSHVAQRPEASQVRLATGQRDDGAVLARFGNNQHQLSAINHLERAVELAPSLPLDDVIVQLPAAVATTVAYEVDTPYHLVVPATAPTVGEYLEAIGCGNYVGRAHVGLAGLYRETGELRQAEDHLDAATVAGLALDDEWLALAADYEQAERHNDAARVYLKTASHGHQITKPLKEAWRNVREAFR